MHVTVEDQSTIKKVLHVEIPVEVVSRELNAGFDQIRKTAKIKGFRPGKAPMSMLKRLYRDQVHADVSIQLIQSSLPNAIREKALNIIGDPQINPSVLSEEGPFTYSATIEIKPEIDDIDFKGLTLKKPLYACTDEEVDHQLTLLRKNLAKLQDIAEPRPAQEKDAAIIDYQARLDGRPVADLPDEREFHLMIGSGAIDKAFDQQVVGMTIGETRAFEVAFPETHGSKTLAGNTIRFTVTLKNLKEEILPELNDDLAGQFGPFDSLDQLKTEIRKNLQSGYDRRGEQELHEQVFAALLEKTSFEVPEIMVQHELDGILDEIDRTYSAYNLSLEALGQTKEALSEKYRDTAVKQAKRHLILNKIIEQEKMAISDDELAEGFESIAKSMGQPADMIKRYYQANPEQIDVLRYTLLEKKAMRIIIEGSTVEEVTPAPLSPDTAGDQA
ncbi:MAG: trigger factor [Thermodesulfobacteriota bacterium]|nr:trigger factor [Thermodesulfobacteriota bacterium]